VFGAVLVSNITGGCITSSGFTIPCPAFDSGESRVRARSHWAQLCASQPGLIPWGHAGKQHASEHYKSRIRGRGGARSILHWYPVGGGRLRTLKSLKYQAGFVRRATQPPVISTEVTSRSWDSVRFNLAESTSACHRPFGRGWPAFWVRKPLSGCERTLPCQAVSPGHSIVPPLALARLRCDCGSGFDHNPHSTYATLVCSDSWPGAKSSLCDL